MSWGLDLLDVQPVTCSSLDSTYFDDLLWVAQYEQPNCNDLNGKGNLSE